MQCIVIKNDDEHQKPATISRELYRLYSRLFFFTLLYNFHANPTDSPVNAATHSSFHCFSSLANMASSNAFLPLETIGR